MILNSSVGVLELFTSNYSKQVYGWQIAKELKMNQKTISNILKKLEKENILKFKIEGKNKYYFLNTFNRDVWSFLEIAEIGKKLRFLKHNRKLKELFYNMEDISNGILAIFGSYASFANRPDSDIDVFVCGKVKDVKKIEDIYNIKINVKKINPKQFITALKDGDFLINEIVSNHVILKGQESFIQLVRENYDFNKVVS